MRGAGGAEQAMSGNVPDLERFQASLTRTPGAVRALLEGIDNEDARWRPSPEHWSIVEIVNHMADEDADDFVPRLEATLRDPAAAWAPIDPPGAARERRYNERALAPSIDRFAAVRISSLNWLEAATAGEAGGVSGELPDWGRAHEHRSIGPIRAGDLLTSWVAHDHLHLRQLAKRLFQLVERDSGGFTTLYAGEWGA
jgi:hypothetical protein